MGASRRSKNRAYYQTVAQRILTSPTNWRRKIVTGDFNADARAPVQRSYMDAFYASPLNFSEADPSNKVTAWTFVKGGPRAPFGKRDYIFFAPDGRATSVQVPGWNGSGVPPGYEISDHSPLVATIPVKGP